MTVMTSYAKWPSLDRDAVWGWVSEGSYPERIAVIADDIERARIWGYVDFLENEIRSTMIRISGKFAEFWLGSAQYVTMDRLAFEDAVRLDDDAMYLLLMFDAYAQAPTWSDADMSAVRELVLAALRPGAALR